MSQWFRRGLNWFGKWWTLRQWLRIITVVGLTLSTLIVAHHYYWPKTITATDLSVQGPTIEVQSRESGVRVVVARARLSPDQLVLHLIARVKSREPAKLHVIIRHLVAFRGKGWTISKDGILQVERTWLVPPGIHGERFSTIFLKHCSCYSYRSPPYLVVSALSPEPESSPLVAPEIENALGQVASGCMTCKTLASRPNLVTSISQDIFEFDGEAPGGGVYNMLSNYPVQKGDTWSWSNVQQASFTAISIRDKDNSDFRTFLSGILLGVFGAGLLLIIDRLFDKRDDGTDRSECVDEEESRPPPAPRDTALHSRRPEAGPSEQRSP
jgi:hypothetical protein